MMTEDNDMPIIKKSFIDYSKIKNLKITNFKNYKSVNDYTTTIIDMFNYDYVIDSIWNNPLKYIGKLNGFLAVSSPDYSIYPNMNRFELEHNVFKSRWIGAFFQENGINVIPTVSWSDKKSYDICFSGIDKNSTVIISTLGVSKNKTMFLEGFNEMKKRIEPNLIIVVGTIFKEMTGDFLLYELKDTFNQNTIKTISLFDSSKYIRRNEEGDYYGW